MRLIFGTVRLYLDNHNKFPYHFGAIFADDNSSYPSILNINRDLY